MDHTHQFPPTGVAFSDVTPEDMMSGLMDGTSDKPNGSHSKSTNGPTTNGNAAKPTPLDPKDVGMTVGLKQLYSGDEDKRGRFIWQTEVPKDLGKVAEDAESEKWAIIVRRARIYGDPKRVLALHSIVIQSPFLKEVLKNVLKGYPGVTSSLKRLEFSGRYVIMRASPKFITDHVNQL